MSEPFKHTQPPYFLLPIFCVPQLNVPSQKDILSIILRKYLFERIKLQCYKLTRKCSHLQCCISLVCALQICTYAEILTDF